MPSPEMKEERHAIMLENLFYLLCGLDTTHIKVGIRDKKYTLVIDPAYPEQLVLPFEALAVNIRIFNKFILRSQYSSDAVKRIVSSCFEQRVAEYLRRVVELRKSVQDIEMLMVAMKDDADEFCEMREVVDNVKGIGGVAVLNLLNERRSRTVRFVDFYSMLMDPCVKKVAGEVDSWVTEGLILGTGFMVRRNESVDGFDECVWTHRYVVVEENVPYFLVQNKALINNCGRVVNIGKKMLGKSVLEDAAEEYRRLGLGALNRYLNMQFLEALRPDIERELETMHKYVLLNDSSFYLDVFQELGNEVFVPTERTVIKMNAIRETRGMNGMSFRRLSVSLNEYVLKILSVQTQPTHKQHLSVLQSLACEYRPATLRSFLSAKTLSELEIIFRFLFTLMSLSHYMGEFREFRFAKIAGTVIDRFRFAIHSEMRPVDIRGDMDSVVADLLSKTKRWLRELHLTSERMYCVWAGLFDLCFEFLNVEYKAALEAEEMKMFEDSLICTVGQLRKELESSENDQAFVCFLEGIDWSMAFR